MATVKNFNNVEFRTITDDDKTSATNVDLTIDFEDSNVLVDSTLAVNLTLPDPQSISRLRKSSFYVIRKAAGSLVILAPTGLLKSDGTMTRDTTINGAASYTVAADTDNVKVIAVSETEFLIESEKN